MQKWQNTAPALGTVRPAEALHPPGYGLPHPRGIPRGRGR